MHTLNRNARRLIAIVFLAMGLNLAGPVAAAYAETDLHLIYLPHRLTETSDKQYDRLLDEIFAGTELTVAREASPMKRALTLFLSDRDSCLFPISVKALHAVAEPDAIVSSELIDIVSLRLYTPTGDTEKAFTSVDDFDPRRVGYIAGSGTVQGLGPKHELFVPIPSEEQLIRMLELGRLDAFLGHHPDTALALEDLNRPGLLRVSPITVSNVRFPISFVCHDTADGRQFIEEVNARIRQLHQDGEIRRVLGPHANLPTDAEDAIGAQVSQ
ncbi:transporter substrate-binding domain-containing protein [Labrenzia sp. R4_1]|uniref:transporter substrate-binding domain-containing protein n=1 Tax=Labrenzia sp. R4_1 TaxID=2821106 RepID=UPI001ADA7AD2|nr:transporter substrate-binding domain-containing protein [Labrenzia sp. R4_1]MBO9427107.1 transporter substrate-binding domain-containing protein [Labrenzia sp. R4_1]